ncbi:MAG: T9SS type A sorting domain-containing protein [Chlorobiota bacterium]
MENVAGYYVIVTDKDGNDSTYAIAYANDNQVQFPLESNEGISIRVAAIDEEYRSGCPSEPIDITTDVETEPITGLVFDESRIAIVPNPVSDITNISFKLNGNSYVRLGVYDMYGNRIAEIAEGFYESGVINNSWNPKGLPSGTYLVKLEAEDMYTTQKLILIK